MGDRKVKLRLLPVLFILLFTLFTGSIVLADLHEEDAGAAEEDSADSESAETDDQVQKPGIKPAAASFVTTWDSFVDALADPDVDVINIGASFSRTGSNPGSIARTITINGNGFTIDFGSGGTSSNGIILNAAPAGTVLTLNDFVYIKTQTQGTPLFNQTNAAAGTNWNIVVNNVRTGSGNQAGLIGAQNASVTVNGTDNVLSGYGSNVRFFNVKNFYMDQATYMSIKETSGSTYPCISINGGEVIMEEKSVLELENGGSSTNNRNTGSGGICGSLTYTELKPESRLKINVTDHGYSTSGVTSEFLVEDGAYCEIYSSSVIAWGNYESNSYSSSAGSSVTDNKFTVRGSDTVVKISGEGSSSGANDYPAMYLQGDNCELLVTDGAEMEVASLASRYSSGLAVQGEGAMLNVTNKSRLSISRNDSYTGLYHAALRFKSTGNMTLIVDDAEVDITAVDGSSAAIRMYGGENDIIVRNGGLLLIEHQAATQSSADNTNYAGIQYTTGRGTRDSFTVEGAGSSVEINAEKGPAIRLASNNDITVGEGSVFHASGRTSSLTSAIFEGSSNDIAIIIDNPLYFDFTNKRPGGGRIFDCGSSSTLKAVNTNLSVWEHGQYLEGNPTNSWITFDFAMYSTNYRYVESSSLSEFTSIVSAGNSGTGSSATIGFQKYSRISANNAKAVVDELRPSTDADQKVYGHVTIPEGRLGSRDAHTKEVFVTFDIYKKDGSVKFQDIKAYTTGADTEGGGIAAYTDPARGGIFEVDLGPGGLGLLSSGEYLEEGDKIVITSAWRGFEDADPSELYRNIYSDAEDIADPVTTRHVVPPMALAASDVDIMQVTTRTMAVSGTSAEIGATIYLYKTNAAGTNTEVWKDSGGQPYTWTVASDGTFTVTLPERLLEDEVLAIALNDNKQQASGLAENDQAVLEANTFLNNGNENPAETLVFHDTTFNKRLTFDKTLYFGALEIDVSDEVDYGIKKITTSVQKYPASNMRLKVWDDRVQRKPWILTAKLELPFTKVDENTGQLIPADTIEKGLVYSYQGQEEVLSTTRSTTIWQDENASDTYDVFANWYSNSATEDGLYAKIHTGDAKIDGYYLAKIRWTVADVPSP